jgi:hypothetical protein
MKPKIFRERGQALILIAFAAIALFAITGLAIDGSAKLSDRRHAQNAADTAAVAGALEMAQSQAQGETVGVKCPPQSGSPTTACADVIDAAKNRAYANSYTDDKVSSIVAVNIPPTSGIYSHCNDLRFDCNDYVQVVITSTKNTWFMRVLGIKTMTNVVSAVASKISDTDFFNISGSAVVALRPDDCALMSQGNTSVVVNGGGIYSNSADPTCSFKKETCAGTTDINNTDGSEGSITMVGGASINTGCPPSADLDPAGAKQIPFPPPFEELPMPVECSIAGTHVTGNPSTVTLQPGHYTAMPPKPNINVTLLEPGVYCIDTTLTLNAGEIIKVNRTTPGVDPGVFLYFKPGGSFTFNGGAGVKLWGINDANVAIDPNVEKYKGYLMYVAPNYALATVPQCKINGHSGSDYPEGDVFIGSIFAPYCDITINGKTDSNAFNTQLIGYTVKFAGGANINLTYTAGNSPDIDFPLQVGLTK